MAFLQFPLITEVCSVVKMFSRTNQGGSRKNRTRCALVHKYEGETVYNSNGKTVYSDCNHLVFLPKGCSYEWKCTSEGHFYIIEFEADTPYDEPISLPIRSSEQISKMIKELDAKRNLNRSFADAESIRDLYSVFLVLFRAREEGYTPSEKQKKLAPAIEYITKNYHESISNDTLAAMVGISTVYFRKLFSSIMGVSPIAYARKIRIEKAKELLKSDYSSLTEVAELLGYSSIYDFSRDFKKHTGVAPSEF